MELPLLIEHIAPPPEIPSPPPTYDYGAVGGTIFFNLTIDSEDYSEYFSRHHLYNINSIDNPENYLLENLIAGENYYLQPITSFKENNSYFYLYWPYTGGNASNDIIMAENDQTIVKDYIRNAGILKGKLEFTGILKTDDLTSLSLVIFGANSFYVPGGSIPQLTAGGSSCRSWFNIDDPYISYLFFLTEGPWLPYYLSASTTNFDKGYRSDSSMTLYDYNYNYDGKTFDFGQPVEILPNMSVVQDREYCTGSVVIRIKVQGGGLLSNPFFSGTGSRYNENDKQELFVSVSGSASVENHEAPAVEVFGPQADYTLTVGVKLEDESTITFAAIPVTIECNVRKIKDVAGPDIVIDYPPAELVTNAKSITVRGNASDGSGINRIVINNGVIPQIGNPEFVTFSYDLPLNTGWNTIITKAYNVTEDEGYDERTVYRDPSPSVSILSPAEGSIYPVGSTIPLKIGASDQGYGFLVKVYMDGDLIEEIPGKANETSVESMIRVLSLVPISAGTHLIRAEAIDAYGNEVFDTVTISTDSWSPTLSILLPAEGSKYNGNATVPVKIEASDQGIGFNLEVFLDNTSFGQAEGPGNKYAPEDIIFENNSVGPHTNGEHVLKAVVTDTGGNTITIERIFQIDNSLPSADIILYPGWIAGSITTNLTDHSVSNISISASGNGNSSSKNVNDDN